jgi:hypothetical protein
VKDLGLGVVGSELKQSTTTQGVIPYAAGSRIRKAISMRVAIEVHRLTQRAEIGEAGGTTGLFASATEGRQQHRNQKRDNSDDDQQFHEGEPPAAAVGGSPPKPAIYNRCVNCASWGTAVPCCCAFAEMSGFITRHDVSSDCRKSCPRTPPAHNQRTHSVWESISYIVRFSEKEMRKSTIFCGRLPGATAEPICSIDR